MTVILKTQGSDLAPLAECPAAPASVAAVRPTLHHRKPAARHR
jgi:hypothetical protein